MPALTAETSSDPKYLSSGITMSRLAFAPPTVLVEAPQSVMTQPVKPIPTLRSASEVGFSQAYLPLSRLYEPITAPTPAFTAASKGA